MEQVELLKNHKFVMISRENSQYKGQMAVIKEG